MPSGPDGHEGRHELTILRLGARGDGVAEHEGRPLFVAGALPGERVQVAMEGRDRALALDILAVSPDRIAPICAVFGTCGGCAVQHLAQPSYAAWKRELVVEALSRAGLPAPVANLIDAHGEGRRRVTFHARAGRARGDRAQIGFMRARSHDLVPIEACPVLAPGLARAPAVAQALAALLASAAKPLDIQITTARAGLDVDLRGHGQPAGAAGERLRLSLSEAATRLDLARLSLHGDLIIERRPPVQRMGEVEVLPPPGSFLQATARGEEILARLVCDGIGAAPRVADLFAGTGPFALALASQRSVKGRHVLAVESQDAAMTMLDRAARLAQPSLPVSTQARDLFRRPLLATELARFDAIVLDPPRAGAEAQCQHLATADVPRVVYVSCDVTTFARDAALLQAGGFALDSVTPIDQFRHSPHVELVGVFTRPVSRARRRSS